MMRQTSQRAAAGGRQYVFHDGMDSRGQAERCGTIPVYDTSSRVAPQETVSNEQSPVPAFLYWGSFFMS